MQKNFKNMVSKAWSPEEISEAERADYKEVVINACYGGYGLSDKADRYLANKYGCDGKNLDRDDERLIECVKMLGENAGGSCAELAIETIPACYSFDVEEYDGFESIRLKPKKAVIKELVLANDIDSLIDYLDAIGLCHE